MFMVWMILYYYVIYFNNKDGNFNSDVVYGVFYYEIVESIIIVLGRNFYKSIKIL